MNRRAFTLVEMLAVLGVISFLVIIAVPATGRYFNEGRKAKEISSARKLVAAYITYASDHDGVLMAGYRQEAVTDAAGKPLPFPANARYPWRLAAYLDYDMSAILFNGNENALKDEVDMHYAASVSPNLGMNVTFVGGDYGSGSDLVPSSRSTGKFGPFCVTRLSQISRPATLMVFASARRGRNEVGFYQIKSPMLTTSRWSGKWDPDASAESFGFVDMRYNGKCVAAMMDGHVEMLDEEGIRDMRHWSNQAAERNEPHFRLAKQQ